MASSNHFQKEDKLISVFNLFKQGSTSKNCITFDSMLNAVKALNLNINENDIKNCFEKYNEEIDFETFKKIIFDYEIENKDIKKKQKVKKLSIYCEILFVLLYILKMVFIEYKYVIKNL